MLCAGAAAQGRTRGLNFFVWNFAWDRLASRLYAATATPFHTWRYQLIIRYFSFNKMHLEMVSAKCQPFCLSLNVLKLKFSLGSSEKFPLYIIWYKKEIDLCKGKFYRPSPIFTSQGQPLISNADILYIIFTRDICWVSSVRVKFGLCSYLSLTCWAIIYIYILYI